MKIILLLSFFGIYSLFGDVTISKSVVINHSEYIGKTNKELKKILLQKVKLAAANEIFGDFIKQTMVLEDGKLINEVLVSQKRGIIHLKKEPIYSNGKNFGDLMISVDAYATKKDIDATKPHTLTLDNFQYTNDTLAIKELKKAAIDAFLVEIFSKKIKKLKEKKDAIKIARELTISIDLKNIKLNPQTSSYTIDGSVKYIPYMLEMRVF